MLNSRTNVHAATMYDAVRGRRQGSFALVTAATPAAGDVAASPIVASAEGIGLTLRAMAVGSNACGDSMIHRDPEPIDHTSGRPTKTMCPTA